MLANRQSGSSVNHFVETLICAQNSLCGQGQPMLAGIVTPVVCNCVPVLPRSRHVSPSRILFIAPRGRRSAQAALGHCLYRSPGYGYQQDGLPGSLTRQLAVASG